MEYRLIIAADPSWTGGTVVLDSRTWRIKHYPDFDSLDNGMPPYYCISYTWGEVGSAIGLQNQLDIDAPISSRTLTALESAICSTRNSDIQAYWIDALCVPPEDGPARFATLESMGLIYSRAAAVVVVLESTTFDILSYNAQSLDTLSEASMRILDRNDWVTSVWTYQEIVNAARIQFVGLDTSTWGSTIEGEDFLNAIGFSLEQWKKQHKLGSRDVMQTFPGLSNLEDCIADWMTAGYLQRSMLACLMGLAKRKCQAGRESNRLYALLGTLTQEPSWSSGSAASGTVLEALSEKAMGIAEQRGDFSAVYTTDMRDSRPGRRWRPLPQSLTPVICWHSLGEARPGRLTSEGLWLDDMVALPPLGPSSSSQSLDPLAKDTMTRWLGGWLNGDELDSIPTSLEDIERVFYNVLTTMGFTGSRNCSRLSHGLLYLQSSSGPHEVVEAWASGSISWTFGAPAIAKIKQGMNSAHGYTAGVYIGLPLRDKPKCSVFLD